MPLNGRCNELKRLKYWSNDLANDKENIWYAVKFNITKEKKRRLCKSAHLSNIKVAKSALWRTVNK